jgi:subtilase family serine protease
MFERLGPLGLLLLLALVATVRAQTPGNPSAPPLITTPIVESNLVTLAGNVRPEANAANDRGPVPDGFAMDHMFLQLQRPAALEQTLRGLIDQMHDPASPNYHQWLTPGQFGAQFAPAPSDIQKITGWLQGHGFSVNTVYPSGMTIDFSGTAGQVAAAFHTAIHYLDVGGVTHFANMSDPQIPAALAPAVVGVVSLHNFRPRAQYTTTTACPTNFQVTSTCHLVAPADLATIYNFNPVYNAGNTGPVCAGWTLYNCYLPSGTTGVLSTSNNSYVAAFTAGVGWDFATGIGTVNVANLVMNWKVKTNTHDVNADSLCDLLWEDSNGNIAVWLMNGATVIASGGIGNLPPSA